MLFKKREKPKNDKEKSKSQARVRRVVGILDGLLTIAFSIQIIVFTFYPLVQQQGTNRFNITRNRLENNGLLKDDGTKGKVETEEDRCMFIGWPTFCTMNIHRPPKENTDKFWTWAFIGLLFSFYASIPISASIALVMSTRPKLEPHRPVEMARFWMACNIITILLVTDEFFISILLHFLGAKVGLPVPTLIYLGFRAIFTVLIWKQLDIMGPTPISTLDAELLAGNMDAMREEFKRFPFAERYPLPEFHRIKPLINMPIRAFEEEEISMSV